MKRSIPLLTAASLWVALFATGCGPTIGDPCTTDSDCGDGLCVNESWAPGGYCSRRCGATADKPECPRGSVCVPGSLNLSDSACFLSCDKTEDCRSGYTCSAELVSEQRVCEGTF